MTIVVGIILFIVLCRLFIYNRWLNRIVNIILFVIMITQSVDIACACIVILFIRFFLYLNGPAEDKLDDIYYSRYRNAKMRYERRNKRR